jgi:hypothetical protein
LESAIPGGEISREAVRIACVAAALELRVGQDTPGTVISRAKEFEAYVVGQEPPAQ